MDDPLGTTDGRYWVYDSYHEGQLARSYPNVHGFSISIVLDFDARHEFSAVRLLILCKRSEDLDTIRIEKCNDLEQCTSVVRDVGYRHWYRSRLVVARFEKDHAIQLPHPRICTISYELVADDDNGLVLVETSAEETHTKEHETPFRRVAYDCIQPIDPLRPALLVFLSINQPLKPFPIETRPERDNYPRIPVHSVRIIPVPSERREAVILPPHVIRCIVQFAVGSKYIGWRSALRNYSLVSKAWEHVLELFFELFDGDGWDRMDVHHVLRTLHWRPHYGASIRRHDYIDYRFTNELYSRTAFVEILRYATQVTHLRLSLIPHDVVPLLLSILPKLYDVRDFVVRQPSSMEEESPAVMNMADFQKAIADWKQLKSLRLTGWGSARTEYSLPDHLECPIETLSLRRGEPLVAGQLLRFANPKNCHLTHLSLESIIGPSNAEFRGFLSIIAPTLNTIDLHLCRFARASPDEEFALDAVMPEMKQLLNLMATSSDISILSVIRRPRPKLPEQSPPNGTIVILSAGPGVTIGEVERAMHVTEWSSVVVTWRNLPAWDPASIARAERVARGRGIGISLRQSWST